MISPSGDITAVLNEVGPLPLPGVLERVTAEKHQAEGCWKREPALSHERERMLDYTQSLRCLLFWLTRRTKPRNCKSFPAFRALTESLVGQGTFAPETLAAFGADQGGTDKGGRDI